MKVYTHEVCPRIRKCGFFTPPEVFASLVGYHRERGYRQDEVLDMGLHQVHARQPNPRSTHFYLSLDIPLSPDRSRVIAVSGV